MGSSQQIRVRSRHPCGRENGPGDGPQTRVEVLNAPIGFLRPNWAIVKRTMCVQAQFSDDWHSTSGKRGEYRWKHGVGTWGWVSFSGNLLGFPRREGRRSEGRGQTVQRAGFPAVAVRPMPRGRKARGESRKRSLRWLFCRRNPSRNPFPISPLSHIPPFPLSPFLLSTLSCNFRRPTRYEIRNRAPMPLLPP